MNTCKNFTRAISKAIPMMLLILFLLPEISFGQGQGNIWYTGAGIGLDFNTNPPGMLTNGNPALIYSATGEGVGSMSDANGNLLFYTNGNKIYDKTHTAMPLGTGLNGDDNTVQTGLIVPVNGNPNQYYLISTGSGGGKPVKWVTIDMTLPGNGTVGSPLGDVVLASKGGSNGTTLVASASEGALAIPEYTAANTPTGNYWIITHITAGADYYVSKATAAGISLVSTQTVGFVNPGQGVQMYKTNSCFDKIGVALYNSGRVEILPFDNVNGIISAPSLILSGTGGAPFLNPEVYGIEFSPSGRFLYVTESGLGARKTVYQFDISLGAGTNPAAVLASKSFYTAGGEVIRFGALQLGPDGKIYFPGYNNAGVNNLFYLNAIPTPDVAWTKPTPVVPTDLQYEQYTFQGIQIGEGLPPVLKNLLTQVRIFYNNPCEGGTTNFSYLFGGSASSVSWNFGDPGSGVNNTSGSPTPSHTYATAGTYPVTLTLIDQCGRTRTGTANVIVKTGPVVSVPATACTGTNVTFTGTGANAANYIWSDFANMSSPTGPSSTYTCTSCALPKTVYVQDPTPLATYTVGQTSVPDCFSPTIGFTYFEVYTSTTITSFQLQCKTAPAAANVSIQNDLGTITYWGPVAAPVAASALLTFNPNVTLAPGKYRLWTSSPSNSFCRNTSTTPDGGRDVPGVINVTGENTGIKAGAFFNIGISLPDPCGVRAYTVTANCPAPVDLLYFKGEKGDNVSLLSWATTQEKNNSHFLVQRSADGIAFNTISTVAGAGNSNVLLSYAITDFAPLSGKNYYRLVQVDFDGSETKSKIVIIDFNSTGVSVAPNPFQSNTTIHFENNLNAIVEVTDISGRELEVFYKSENNNQLEVGSSLVAGTYLVKVISDSGTQVFKVIKE